MHIKNITVKYTGLVRLVLSDSLCKLFLLILFLTILQLTQTV
jgi:hypothetical protein